LSTHFSYRFLVCLLRTALLIVLCSGFAAAQTSDSLSARIDRVMSRPEFRHANFGIEFYSLDTGKVVYALNAEKMFVPASTTKLLTEGTVLAKLGADYRFHTCIYRTGPLDSKGRLKGDLVLVASGDPNLSNRIQPDGTLAFVDEDHSYNGPALSGDPLTVIKQLAKDIAGKGVRRIEGRVLVDASLVPDGAREGGTNVVMSSIMVNDNVIDVVVTPGAKAGDPATIATSPQTSYVKFSGQVLTSPSSGKTSVDTSDPIVNGDGTTSVLITGTITAGSPAQTLAVGVLSPTNFAQTVLREALTASGISIKPPKKADAPMFPTNMKFYVPDNLLAEHTSLPLSEEVKVTLKVSQNLHAGMGPYLLGALATKNAHDLRQAGFGLEQQFLQDAHLDMSGISQGDGEGGDWADLFSPDFVVQYLKYWTTRPEYPIFFKALPILGRDGTLAKIQVSNPGAGHVFAKTGTFGSEDRVNSKIMLNGKGLAGYIVTAKGEKLVFAAYVNHVSLPPDPDAPQNVAGQALGEIAAAAYNAPLEAIANGN
jgi:PBP4 family serine-type D-alanyl-D-alanine carboxypeptidase